MFLQKIFKFILNTVLYISVFLILFQMILYVTGSAYPSLNYFVLDKVPLPEKLYSFNESIINEKEDEDGFFIKEEVKKYTNCRSVSKNTTNLNNIIFNCGKTSETVNVRLLNVQLPSNKEEGFEEAKLDFFTFLGKKHYIVYIMAEKDNQNYAVVYRQGVNINEKILDELTYAKRVEGIEGE